MNTRELILIVALMEFGMHYFPWRKVLGYELPRPAAYTFGLLGMMMPFSLWLMDNGHYEILQTLWFVVASAGMTVYALYGVDHLVSKGDESAEREALLNEVVKRLEQMMREHVRDEANEGK